MRRKLPIVCSIALVLGAFTLASAHLPPGELFFAAQFPDNLVPVIDGKHADWDILPDQPYSIRNEKLFDPAQFQEAGRGEIDISDANIRHRFGWNENFNKLYLATQIFDNIHNIDRSFGTCHCYDDNWETEINPDHSPSEEQNLEGNPVNNISYKWVVPPLDGVYQSIEPIGDLAWLSDGTDYVSFGWSFEGEQFGESTYYYEMAIIPVDALPRENATPENTDFHNLEEEEIIHMSVTMGDIDVEQENHSYQGFWSMSPESCCKGVNDFVMAPMEDALRDLAETAVEETSWGQIKAGYDR
jgi:hypothetical protein